MSEVRLIDANALKEEIEKLNEVAYDVNHVMCMEFVQTYQIQKAIDNAPTVTPSEIQAIMSDYLVYRKDERPKGEWKLIRVADHCGIHDSFVCPFCNYEREYRKKNFCEECGADLRGKKNDREDMSIS